MPLVRISLREGTGVEYRQKLSDGIHRAMVESLEIPADDRFQIISEHDEHGLIFDPAYLGMHRSQRIVFVQITLSSGRKPQQKRKLYKLMSEFLMQAVGLRPEDLLINLV